MARDYVTLRDISLLDYYFTLFNRYEVPDSDAVVLYASYIDRALLRENDRSRSISTTGELLPIAKKILLLHQTRAFNVASDDVNKIYCNPDEFVLLSDEDKKLHWTLNIGDYIVSSIRVVDDMTESDLLDKYRTNVVRDIATVQLRGRVQTRSLYIV